MPKTGGYNRNNRDGDKRGRHHRRSIQWGVVGAESLRSFVEQMTNAGCAVMFGRTSDGGALSLLVLAGNDKVREYITDPADAMPVLAELLADFAGEQPQGLEGPGQAS